MTLSKCTDAFNTVVGNLPLLDRDGLEELDDMCSEVLRRIHTTQRQRPQNHWNRLTTAMHRRIFELSVAEDDPTIHSNTPAAICRVSKSWCYEAERTPLLWTNIVIRARTWIEFCLAIRRAALWIHRSGSKTIRFHITFPPENSILAEQVAHLIMGYVSTNLYRCSYIRIFIFGGISATKVFSRLQSPAPLLVTFSITHSKLIENNEDDEDNTDDESDGDDAQSVVDGLFGLQPFQLTHVSLPTFNLNWVVPAFGNITVLNIINPPEISTSLARLAAVFRLQKLIEVELSGFVVFLSDDVAQPVLNESVQKLTLCGRNFGDSIGLLDRLDLPSLRYLMIGGFGPSIVKHTLGVTTSQFKSIYSLIITQEMYYLRGISKLVQRMSNLRNAQVRGVDLVHRLFIQGPSILETGGEHVVHCPHLTGFTYLLEPTFNMVGVVAIRACLVNFVVTRAGNNCAALEEMSLPYLNGWSDEIKQGLLQVHPGLRIKVRRQRSFLMSIDY